jgi:ammonia channel protein AmtB
MIQRILAATIGGLVTFATLLVWNVTDFTDPVPAFAIASILGAIGTLIWPVIAAIWARRRIKDRRDAQIQQEVDRQLADQNKR